MLHLGTRIIPAVVAPLLAASALVLSTPERAAAQVSVGFGVVIGRDQGRAIVIVTHDHRLRDIADRVLWLEDGQLTEKPDSLSVVSS